MSTQDKIAAKRLDWEGLPQRRARPLAPERRLDIRQDPAADMHRFRESGRRLHDPGDHRVFSRHRRPSEDRPRPRREDAPAGTSRGRHPSKILLNHGVPRPLRHTLPEHEVHTAYYGVWHFLQICDLISNAVAGGYEMLITCDQSIRSQQNLLQQPITVLTITTKD